MSDFEQLLLILAAIYLTECILWLRPGAVVISAMWGWCYTPGGPIMSVGVDRGGLSLVNPLPFGLPYISEPWPLSVSPEGICLPHARSVGSAAGRDFYPLGMPLPRRRPKKTEGVSVPFDDRTADPSQIIIRFDQLRSVGAVGKDVYINESFVVKTNSWVMAVHMADLLRHLKACQLSQRAAVIVDALCTSLNSATVRSRLNEIRSALALLQLACTALFAYVFILLPLMVRLVPLANHLWWLIPLFFLSVWTAIGLYFRLHQTVYRRARSKRFGQAVVMMLAPTLAMRSASSISGDLLAVYHPLAIAQHFCSKAVFAKFARVVLLEARFPIGRQPDGPEEASVGEIVRWFRTCLVTCLDRSVRNAGYDVDDLIKPPVRASAQAVAYCPRCESQFTDVHTSCAGCGDRPVVAFADLSRPDGGPTDQGHPSGMNATRG